MLRIENASSAGESAWSPVAETTGAVTVIQRNGTRLRGDCPAFCVSGFKMDKAPTTGWEGLPLSKIRKSRRRCHNSKKL